MEDKVKLQIYKKICLKTFFKDSFRKLISKDLEKMENH